MKKKLLSLFLVATMGISICGCEASNANNGDGSENQSVQNENGPSDNESDSANSESDGEYAYDSKGVVKLTNEQFLEFCEVVTITKDNWKEYLGRVC